MPTRKEVAIFIFVGPISLIPIALARHNSHKKSRRIEAEVVDDGLFLEFEILDDCPEQHTTHICRNSPTHPIH